MVEFIKEIHALDVDVLATNGGAVLTILDVGHERYSVFVTADGLEKLAHRTKRELDRVAARWSLPKDQTQD